MQVVWKFEYVIGRAVHYGRVVHREYFHQSCRINKIVRQSKCYGKSYIVELIVVLWKKLHCGIDCS